MEPQDIVNVLHAKEARQFSSRWVLETTILEVGRPGMRILDLGCGSGRSFDWFKQCLPRFEWTGLDIESSPEVLSRTRTDCSFTTYNGVSIPFEDQTFDIVFSNQVFEHVRHPDALLSEVHRVLKPGGRFIGGVSYLEPYHSYSIFNFTPYGWYRINAENGLQPIFLGAGIDSLALIGRSIDRASAEDAWWQLSPLNRRIIEDPSLGVREKNLRMLMSAGHIVFSCVRVEPAAPAATPSAGNPLSPTNP